MNTHHFERSLEPLFTIAAFYKFVDLNNPALLQKELLQKCKNHNILGTIILSHEGINGTLAGGEQNIQLLLKEIMNYSMFSDLVIKFSKSNIQPFKKLKITIKKEIVTLRQPNISVTHKTGFFVEPENWNDLISDPNVLVIDTRNIYETEIGSFKNAVDPKTDTFTEFPEFIQKNCSSLKKKKIAMFCTGGIRCEKASSFLLSQGFENVYQLHGGILKYLEKIPPEKSLWQGECFIFDNRGVV